MTASVYMEERQSRLLQSDFWKVDVRHNSVSVEHPIIAPSRCLDDILQLCQPITGCNEHYSVLGDAKGYNVQCTQEADETCFLIKRNPFKNFLKLQKSSSELRSYDSEE